jgi:Na+/H+ antiporter NhaD/arsenite permease-like protein
MVLVTNHLPYASIVNYVFLIVLTLLIVLWSTAPHKEEQKSASNRRRSILQAFLMGSGGMCIVVGLIFRIQHYPGAVMLLISGVFLSIFYFIIPLIWKTKN